MNTTNKSHQLWKSLDDPDFRKQLIDEHINVGIAFQIRSLRGRQNLTQNKLAELLGDNSKQPMISEWENPNYGKYTLSTLKDMAKAFDVGLLVRFVPFSTLIDWTVDLTSDVIAPPNFREEQNYARALKQISDAFQRVNDTKNIAPNHTGIPEPIEPVKDIVPTTASFAEVI